ncbi:hydroxysqualene dehydroxylase HpnE, partial [Herbaspirillum autotrophicum]|uniref:hydroxysqualene dehydroxylase HpnE n=1 Tax=Herbaspirillum autotrophicum TaxID=180195 RepID=UPI00067D4C99
MTKARHIAIIGGGWAGCAAAVTLARAGHRVTVFEAARVLGGRARRVELDGRNIDNGQHILLGAYRATLKMMRTVGVKPDQAMLRLPLQMRYPPHSGGMDFVAPTLPAPWHMLFALWRSSGLERADKLALARFSTTARWMGWRLNDDCSVSELLIRFDQTERLIRLMWTPLCIAALNTPPQRASAQVFLNVLRDSLGARRAASDMLIPRADLSQLFPEAAAEYILRHGGSVICGSSVQALERAGAQWRVVTASAQAGAELVDGVIIATAPEAAAALLAPHADVARPAPETAAGTEAGTEAESVAGSVTTLISTLRNFSYEPITTCYLQYPASLRLPQALYALQDNAADAAWGQFVFDRGHLHADHAGLLA